MSDSTWLLNARNNYVILNANRKTLRIYDTVSQNFQVIDGVNNFTFIDTFSEILTNNNIVVISVNEVGFSVRYSMDSSTILTKYAGETRVFYMDFVNLLNGFSIQSAAVTSHLRGGGVSDLVISAPTVDGTSVGFLIAGGSFRNTYHIHITVITSDSQTLVGNGLLTILGL